MKFDQMATSIGKAKRADLQKKFQSLILELGVRDDNEHVGTGLGGNSAQLVALMSFRNELIDNPDTTIEVRDGYIEWGSPWFRQVKRKDVRHELDAKLPIPKGTTWDAITSNPRFANGPNVSSWDVLSYASRMCAELARDLDNGIQSKIKPTAMALAGFPMEVVLLSVRMQIQIERLVKYNLDEDKEFGKILHVVNKEID